MTRRILRVIGFDDAPFARVLGGERKLRLIERAGIAAERTVGLLQRLAVHSKLPEPLRTAHLIAGRITTGESRHCP